MAEHTFRMAELAEQEELTPAGSGSEGVQYSSESSPGGVTASLSSGEPQAKPKGRARARARRPPRNRRGSSGRERRPRRSASGGWATARRRGQGCTLTLTLARERERRAGAATAEWGDGPAAEAALQAEGVEQAQRLLHRIHLGGLTELERRRKVEEVLHVVVQPVRQRAGSSSARGKAAARGGVVKARRPRVLGIKWGASSAL